MLVNTGTPGITVPGCRAPAAGACAQLEPCPSPRELRGQRGHNPILSNCPQRLHHSALPPCECAHRPWAVSLLLWLEPQPQLPSALPSGGPCAAVSASPPAGTPCLSGPGLAPHWKDTGQGQAALTPEILGSLCPAGAPRGPGGDGVGEARCQPPSRPRCTQQGQVWTWVGVTGGACACPEVCLPEDGPVCAEGEAPPSAPSSWNTHKALPTGVHRAHEAVGGQRNTRAYAGEQD